MLVGRCGPHFAFEDPHGLAYRAGHVGQPLGAEQQYHHDKQNQQVPNAQAGHRCVSSWGGVLGRSPGYLFAASGPATQDVGAGSARRMIMLWETRSVTVRAVTSLDVVLIMAGVPLAIMVVLGLLTLGPHLVRSRRLRRGRR